MTTPPPNPLHDEDLEALLRESAGLEDAPPHLIHRAELLWKPARRAEAPAPAGPWRRLLASLSFEGGGSGLAMGLRGDPGAARQWLFTCEAHDIDLRAQPVDDGPPATWQLGGQLLGPEGAGEVLLFGRGAAAGTLPGPPHGPPLQRAALGEMSEFSWPALPAGVYRLVLQLGDLQIELPPIELGTGAASAA